MPYDAVVDKARLEGAMTATADAIRAKTGSSETLEWNPDTGFQAAVASITTGTKPVSEKEVNFFDYDGTLLHSYTVEEAKLLTALPPLPEREGLVCQGWNWTLDEVKSVDRPALIGANYDTPDGSTKLHIDTVIDNLPVTLNLMQSAAHAVTVNWGDGSDLETHGASGEFSLTHEYAIGGKYEITLASAEKTLTLGVVSTSAENTRIVCSPDVLLEANLGSNVSAVRGYTFYTLRTLRNVSFSAGIQFSDYSCFEALGSLLFLSLPKNAKSTGLYFCRYPGAMFGVSAPKNFSFGTTAFTDASSLRYAAIPDGQSSVTSACFRNARAMTRVYFPPSVTSIAGSAFSGCSSVLLYDFARHTDVPTLVNVNAFNDMNAACEIRVPAALYGQWVSAQNWATLADHIVGV